MANQAQKTELGRGKTLALWVATVLPAAMFLFAGGNKLAATPQMREGFVNFGFPLWFLYVTGAIEVGSAVLLLIPRTAVFGSVLLVCTMIGAVLTHLKIGDYAHLGVPLVLLALVAIVGYARRAPLVNLLEKLGIFAKKEEAKAQLKAA